MLLELGVRIFVNVFFFYFMGCLINSLDFLQTLALEQVLF